MDEHVSYIGDVTYVYNIWSNTLEGPLGRPWCRWEIIRIYIREIMWKGVDWNYVTQDSDHWRAVVNTVMNLWAP
jgi:hypothetical protein